MKDSVKFRLKQVALNLAILLLAGILFIFLLNKFLLWYTDHGESLTVPDVKGSTIEQAISMLEDAELRVEIQDTTYVPDLPAWAVVDQNPKAQSQVKRGRRIYLTINSEVPDVALPQLTEKTLKETEDILSRAGLVKGGIEYRPDISDQVLEIKYKGRVLQEGDKLPRGSSVTLVVGDPGGQKQVVPDVKGQTYEAGAFIIRANEFVVGRIVPDPKLDRADQNAGIIWKQFPDPLSGTRLAKGDAIDLFITTPEEYERMQEE